MDNILFSANIVLPLFLMIAVGFLAKSIKLIDGSFSSGANALSFKVFLPVLLFYNIYTCDLSQTADLKLMVTAGIGSVLMIIISAVIVCIFEKDDPKRGTMIQALFRSNYLLFATPLCAAMFPENGAAVASLISIIIIPIQNIGSVIVLSIFGSREKPGLKDTFLSILKNPYIIASALGLLFAFAGISLPGFIMKTLDQLSKAATPFALVMLGTELDLKGFKGNFARVFLTTAGKIVIWPAIMIGAAILLGFRGPSYAVLLSLYAAPTAVTSFVMAKASGCDSDLAAQLVVSTSFFSLFTVFGFVLISKALGVI